MAISPYVRELRDPADAAARECWEETGLVVEPVRLLEEARRLPLASWLPQVLPDFYERPSSALFRASAWRPPE
jgi:8-oxo-dGTP pyrophosphatase MutT (NUDIX family)